VVHTIFLSVIAGLTILVLPQEAGRLDELGPEGLLLAIVVVITVLMMYFTSACACGEIAIEDEKSVWDLATSQFPAGTIATGKVLSSAALAVVQLLLAGPFVAIVAGIREESVVVVLRVALVAIPAAAATGALGVLYSAAVDSDVARSVVHWITLLAIVVGPNALPAPWNLLSPVRGLAVAVREGARPAVWLVAAAYAIVTAVCVDAVRRRVARIRSEAI
jgi:hypothetical protein